MDIGFDQIKDMKIKDIIKLKSDKERLEKENKILRAKYPTKANQLNDKDFDIDKFIEGC